MLRHMILYTNKKTKIDVSYEKRDRQNLKLP